MRFQACIEFVEDDARLHADRTSCDVKIEQAVHVAREVEGEAGAYGLAGLRVGYAVGTPRVVSARAVLQIPWAVNSMGLVAARAALADQGIVGVHPDTGETGAIDHVKIFSEEASEQAVAARALTLCPGASWDRSPCGTGTSAKLAILHARGRSAGVILPSSQTEPIASPQLPP